MPGLCTERPEIRLLGSKPVLTSVIFLLWIVSKYLKFFKKPSSCCPDLKTSFTSDLLLKQPDLYHSVLMHGEVTP